MQSALRHFAVPCRFDIAELDLYDELNQGSCGAAVTEFYGCLNPSPFGSGRAAGALPPVSVERLAWFVASCRSRGYCLNYTLNGSCFGGDEFAPEQKRLLLRFVECLAAVGVDRFTVAMPYVIELIARHFPEVQVCASAICRIDSAPKAKFFEDLGARRLVLFEDLNRDFDSLRAIRKACASELEILVNSPCVFGCALREYHYDLMSHSIGFESKFNNFEPWMLRCNLRKLRHPVELIRARGLVRPEDVPFYSAVGITWFKIVGRETSMENIAVLTGHYLTGNFNGNVFDLLPRRGGTVQAYTLANRDLDGFLRFFAEGCNPCTTGCRGCGYCDQYAAQMRTTVPARQMAKNLRHMDQQVAAALADNRIDESASD